MPLEYYSEDVARGLIANAEKILDFIRGPWMRGEVEPFVKRLVDYFDGDVTVILFGSRARGDFNRAWVYSPSQRV